MEHAQRCHDSFRARPPAQPKAAAAGFSGLSGGLLLGPVLEAGKIDRDVTPRHGRGDPVLMRRLHETRVIQDASLHIDDIRMLRCGGEERGAAVRAEVTGELTPAIPRLGEPSRKPVGDPKPRAHEADSDVKRAARAPAAVLAVAEVGRPDFSIVFERDAAADAVARDVARHRVVSPVLAQEVRRRSPTDMALSCEPQRLHGPTEAPTSRCRILPDVDCNELSLVSCNRLLGGRRATAGVGHGELPLGSRRLRRPCWVGRIAGRETQPRRVS